MYNMYTAHCCIICTHIRKIKMGYLNKADSVSRNCYISENLVKFLTRIYETMEARSSSTDFDCNIVFFFYLEKKMALRQQWSLAPVHYTYYSYVSYIIILQNYSWLIRPVSFIYLYCFCISIVPKDVEKIVPKGMLFSLVVVVLTF